MNYMVLTDNSTAASTLMNSFTPKPVVEHTFTAHTLWSWQGATDHDVARVQTSQPQVYATVLLPNPL